MKSSDDPFDGDEVALLNRIDSRLRILRPFLLPLDLLLRAGLFVLEPFTDCFRDTSEKFTLIREYVAERDHLH